MSFLRNHRRFFQFLSILSFAPFYLNKSQTRLIISFRRYVYSLVICCLSISYALYAVYQMVLEFYEEERVGIRVMVEIAQEAMTVAVHSFLVLKCHSLAPKHVVALNDFDMFVNNVNTNFAKGNSGRKNVSALRRLYLSPIVFLVCFCVGFSIDGELIMELDDVMETLQPLFMVASVLWLSFYMRAIALEFQSCAKVLQNYIKVFVNHPSTNDNFLSQYVVHLDEFLHNRRAFEEIFSHLFVVIFMYDMLMLTMFMFLIFYWLARLNELNAFEVFIEIFVPYVFPVWLKNWMVVHAFSGISTVVDEIRKVAVKASINSDKQLTASLELLLLKLQHMEKTKYISANDFFPINYSMLFNMAAAIVTHMLVLLQFQQWEDNQNSKTDANVTSVT